MLCFVDDLAETIDVLPKKLVKFKYERNKIGGKPEARKAR